MRPRKSVLIQENADLALQISSLEGDVSSLEGQLADTQAELRRARAIGGVVGDVEFAIEKLEDDGVIGEEALTRATATVTEEERERLVRAEAARIERERGDEIAATFREEQGPGIISDIKERFSTDGTNERIKAEAEERVRGELEDEVLAELRQEAADLVATDRERARIRAGLKEQLGSSDEVVAFRDELTGDVRAELRSEVIGELETEIREELESDEERDKVRASLREELLQSSRILDFRDQVRAEVADRLRGEVRTEVEEDVVDQERAREPEVRARLRREELASDRTARLRQDTAARLEAEVADMTREEVGQQVADEELRRLLNERAELDAQELARELEARKLEEKFTRGEGIDLRNIAADTVLEIYLGEIGTFSFVEKGQGNQQSKRVEKPTAFFVRKLTVASDGEGRFIVNGDTLFESDSLYERDRALSAGTLIKLGRKNIDDGDAKLVPALRADVPLCYDDVTTDDAFESALYLVADVVIDGVSARNVEHVSAAERDRAQQGQ